MATILMSRTSAEAKATGPAAEEVHHHTDLALLENEEVEINGSQIDETQIEEKTLTPTYQQQAGEPKDHEVAPLLLFVGGRVVLSGEAETTLILPGHDLHRDDILPDETTVQPPLPGGALDLHMVLDRSVPQ